MDVRVTLCDHCAEVVHTDVNGFWVGDDETAECAAFDGGHEVNGSIHG